MSTQQVRDIMVAVAGLLWSLGATALSVAVVLQRPEWTGTAKWLAASWSALMILVTLCYLSALIAHLCIKRGG